MPLGKSKAWLDMMSDRAGNAGALVSTHPDTSIGVSYEPYKRCIRVHVAEYGGPHV